jgi:plastocyanin
MWEHKNMKINRYFIVKISVALIGLFLLEGQLLAEDMTSHEIRILCSGPEPETTKVDNGDSVKFINDTQAVVTITFDNPGIFNPSPGPGPSASKTIDKDSSETLHVGKIGNGTGYTYPGCKKDWAPRSGRIDP